MSEPNVSCDFCHKKFHKAPSDILPHNFCCRQCFGNYSSRTMNPEGYKSFKDYTNISLYYKEAAARLNPTRMTMKVRKKLHDVNARTGTGKSYPKNCGQREHRSVAEELLKRPLQPGEVVHHIDGNKKNNAPDNIFVFASQSEHARYHNNLRWFIRDLKQLEEEEADEI